MDISLEGGGFLKNLRTGYGSPNGFPIQDLGVWVHISGCTPYLPKRWSHWHVSFGNSLRIQVLRTKVFRGFKIVNFSGCFAPITRCFWRTAGLTSWHVSRVLHSEALGPKYVKVCILHFCRLRTTQALACLTMLALTGVPRSQETSLPTRASVGT